MAGIFPPAAQGGVPPGPNADNGYDPGIAVTGEGPLYISNTCTTALVSAQVNAITSEILSAVDRLGGSFNADKITNLGDALVALLLTPLAGKLNKAGDTMTGVLALAADPANPLEAATKQFVEAISSARVLRTGDTMSGLLTLSGAPTVPLHAATKQFVEDHVTTAATAWVDVAGDTMTGPLLLSEHPTAPSPILQAATKKYVDDGLVSVTAGTSVTVTGPELAGNGLSGTPVRFTGIGRDTSVFAGNGLSADPLRLVAVDGGTY